MNHKKFLRRLLQSQTNVRFGDVTALAEAFDFRLTRVSGSHHIFTHASGAQLNLQEVGGQAKPYQLRQFLKLIERYNLKLDDDRGDE